MARSTSALRSFLVLVAMVLVVVEASSSASLQAEVEASSDPNVYCPTSTRAASFSLADSRAAVASVERLGNQPCCQLRCTDNYCTQLSSDGRASAQICGQCNSCVSCAQAALAFNTVTSTCPRGGGVQLAGVYTFLITSRSSGTSGRTSGGTS